MNLEKAHKKIISKQVKNEVLKDVGRELIPFISACMNAAYLITLHDLYGFGGKRLTKILDKVNMQFEALHSKYVTVEEIFKVIEDEVGISLGEGCNDKKRAKANLQPKPGSKDAAKGD